MLSPKHSLRLLVICMIAGANLVRSFSALHPSASTISSSVTPTGLPRLFGSGGIRRKSSSKASILVRHANPRIDADLVFCTWQWCANLGAPSALVAGAVLATLVGLALGAAARNPIDMDAAPLIVFGARMALAPPFVLLHLVHLHLAMSALADEGQLRPPVKP